MTLPKSLHIRRVAYGRRNAGRRVQYLLEPTQVGTAFGIPEEVVLYRWRKRKRAGFQFQGARLKPSVWRAMADALGPNIEVCSTLALGQLDALIKSWRARYATRRALHTAQADGALPFEYLAIPSAETVRALIHACGVPRLRLIIARHRSFAGTGQSGVPDLFLYTTSLRGVVGTARFVEVKKPEEPVRREQEEEIAFLQSLRLSAQVFRLSEPAQLSVGTR